MHQSPELRHEILSQYRAARETLTPEQRKNLRDILRDTDNPARAYDWFIGLLGDDDLNAPETYNPSASEQELLARQLELIEALDTFVADPLSVPPQKHPQLLRHLAYQMERDLPTLTGDPLKPGEHLVSISFNGVKALNQNGAGIHITNLILQRFRQEIDTALRQHDLVDITMIPTQQLWKRVSFRIPKGDAAAIREKITVLEAQVTERIQAYINTFDDIDIPPEAKTETKNAIHLTSGLAAADDSEMDVFDALQVSVMQCEAQNFFDDCEDKREVIRRYLGETPGAQEVLALLDRELPDTSEEQMQHLFETSDAIHRYIVTIAQKHAPMYAEEIPELDGKPGLSEEFFTHTRQDNIGAMFDAFRDAPLTRGEIIALSHLGSLYTQSLFTPAVLKEFTHDQSAQHTRKTQALQSSTERILALAKVGKVTPENALTAKQHLAEAWDHLRRDHRFTDAGLNGLFMNPLFFDETALEYDSPQYLSLDLIGVGAEYLKEAQVAQHRIAATGNTYAAIVAETRTLSENSWRRIKRTFDTVGTSLTQEPSIAPYITENYGLIPAFTKGDEMVIAIPGTIPTEDIIRAMQRSLRELGSEHGKRDARVSLATAIRPDLPHQSPNDRIAAHLDTRVLSEKVGIDIAKKLELIIPDGVTEIARDEHGTIQFRVHWGKTATQTTRWFDVSDILAKSDDEDDLDQYNRLLDEIRSIVGE